MNNNGKKKTKTKLVPGFNTLSRHALRFQSIKGARPAGDLEIHFCLVSFKAAGEHGKSESCKL